MFLLFRIHNL